MDTKELFKKVIEHDDIKGIPLIYVLAVMRVIVEVLGECLYVTEYD